MKEASDFEPEETDRDKRAQDKEQPIDEFKDRFNKALEKWRLKKKKA